MHIATEKRATIHRMVMPTHLCSYGIKAKYPLKSKGYVVEDDWLTTREQTDAFKAEYGVKTPADVHRWQAGRRL